MKCPKCGSSKTVKAGINYQNKRQKMLCKECGVIFQNGKIKKIPTQITVKDDEQILNQQLEGGST